MKLAEYLQKTGKSKEDFAYECGVDPITVYRWLNGTRRFPRQHIHKIMQVTNGKVTANDFVAESAA